MRAKKLLFCTSNNKIPDAIYPIFINWESGTFSAYKDYICHIRQGDTFSGLQKNLWLIAAPVLVFGDLGKGVARLPYTTAYQVQNYTKTLPYRHGLATERINEWYVTEGKTGNKNNDSTKPITVSDVKYEQPLTMKRVLEDLPSIPKSPFKLLSAMIIDAGGKGAWETMVRRTQTMFNSPDEFTEDAQFYLFKSKEAIGTITTTAEKKAKERVTPRHTGSLSKFMDKFEEYLENCDKHDKFKINLIGHSMGTIVANEILHRYSDFPFKHIVYMAAACSINDFRVNVIPYFL